MLQIENTVRERFVTGTIAAASSMNRPTGPKFLKLLFYRQSLKRRSERKVAEGSTDGPARIII
jgi:hypothetical protein